LKKTWVPIIKRKEKKQTPVMVANANHNGQEYLFIQPKVMNLKRVKKLKARIGRDEGGGGKL